MHSNHPGEQGMTARTGSAAHDGGGHRGPQLLNEPAELRHRVLGANHAAPHQHQGLFRRLNQVQQGADVPHVGLGGLQLVAGPAEHGPQTAMIGVLRQGQGGIVRLGGGDVFGDIHQHRAGPARAGDGKGLPQHVGQGVRVLD